MFAVSVEVAGFLAIKKISMAIKQRIIVGPVLAKSAVAPGRNRGN
jgi:hypothetical protein